MSLITANELTDMLGQSVLRLVDATYYLGKPPEVALEQYSRQHIPGAVFFDIDAIADCTNSLPHMVPPLTEFADAMAHLDVRPEHTVVVYDAQGMFSAPRVWWLLRHFGYPDVRVLNGGLPAWLAVNGPTVSGDSPVLNNPQPITTLTVKPDVVTRQQLVDYLAETLQTSTDKPAFAAIVDARAADRFEGRVDEPRPGLGRGHIPTSFNLPWQQLIDPATQQLNAVPNDALQQIIHQAQATQAPVVCTCGSGMTACIVALALHQAGEPNVAIYDGSWAEWGADPALPTTP